MKKVFEWFKENAPFVFLFVAFAVTFGCFLLPMLIYGARECWALV
jgi:hypothetical protein